MNPFESPKTDRDVPPGRLTSFVYEILWGQFEGNPVAQGITIGLYLNLIIQLIRWLAD